MTPPRRLAYLGTPAMAVPPLEALVAAGFDVAGVVGPMAEAYDAAVAELESLLP